MAWARPGLTAMASGGPSTLVGAGRGGPRAWWGPAGADVGPARPDPGGLSVPVHALGGARPLASRALLRGRGPRHWVMGPRCSARRRACSARGAPRRRRRRAAAALPGPGDWRSLRQITVQAPFGCRGGCFLAGICWVLPRCGVICARGAGQRARAWLPQRRRCCRAAAAGRRLPPPPRPLAVPPGRGPVSRPCPAPPPARVRSLRRFPLCPGPSRVPPAHLCVPRMHALWSWAGGAHSPQNPQTPFFNF